MTMHPRVFEAFDRICRARSAGGDVLEIGAVASPETLLCLPALARARSRIGVNLAGDATFDGFRIIGANANDLAGFADASFDTVLSNSVLEHDPCFWLSLEEMRRVARPGALIVIGVPGFTSTGPGRILKRVARLPLIGPVFRRLAPSRLASTATLVIHDFPGDYYRFSPQAMREVLLEGLDAREVASLMSPPRLVGSGTVSASVRSSHRRRLPGIRTGPPGGNGLG
jgi:SAM-dependent methyltransferase